ncbi:MAG: AAA family ATPase [Campylobacterales bacterium]|nr:AAA family ATPase [Campylobacterales bacterium]
MYPGTGKTVVSIKRLQNAADIGKKGIIFTYGKLLRKTIEEKLENNPNMPVDNIHNWMWKAQDDGQRNFFDIMTADKNLHSTVELLKSKGITYDEILVDEGQDLSLNTYKILKELTTNLSISADNAQQINNREEATDEESILELFPKLNRFELDEVFRSAYEIYKFAIQFVPNNARANDPTLLERLKRKNSGADKPFVWLEDNLDSVYSSIQDIVDENPTDNIGILFERTLHADEAERRLSQDYDVSKYHNQEVIPSQLNNIIITTFKSAKGIEFDIVIIPYFPNGAMNIPEEYYVGATRAKNQVHFLAIKNIPNIMSHFNKETYELIDNRG